VDDKTFLVREDNMRRFLDDAFGESGLGKKYRSCVVDQLVVSSLRGVDTHGVILAERYIDGIREGILNRSPRIRTVRDSPGVSVIDGDDGPGQYVATAALKMAADKADESGIGAVFAVNLGHVGALSYYGLLLAERKMAGMVFVNADPSAPAWGGATPLFGTNPLCLSFPSSGAPIVLDIATTVVAGQKIALAAKSHKKIPKGWALDQSGAPTTDPEEALKGSMLPFGGHKGYGIMLAIEIYCAIMSGGLPGYQSKDSVGYKQGGFYIQAIKVGALRPYREYLGALRGLEDAIKSSKLMPGYEGVYLPGEIEARTFERRKAEGIPVNHRTMSYFDALADELGIAKVGS
jgi:LDH2 family malate/lactate/ureidoglycolate dehydrogenase